MTDEPDVTIVMSAYNERRWLPENINAVLSQSHTNIEFIVMDDASTDGSDALLSSYHDPRLRTIRNQERRGWLNNINLMAEMARGRLIKLLCPDDVMTPECVASALALFKEYPHAGYIFCDFQYYSESGTLLAARVPANYPCLIPSKQADRLALFDGCFANTSCLFVPRDKWMKVGGMRDLSRSNPARWPTVEDFDIMVRLQEHNPVGYIANQHVYVRAHSQQVQGNPAALPLLVEGSVQIMDALLNRVVKCHPEEAIQIRKRVLRLIAQRQLNDGLKLLLAGQWRAGSSVLMRVSEVFPLRHLVMPWLGTVAAPAIRRRMRLPQLGTKTKGKSDHRNPQMH